MAEYIERETALEIVEMYRWGKHLDRNGSLNAVRDGVSQIPAADVVPVVHGRWILPTKIGHRYFDVPHCSACDGVPCGVDENTKYCPNCGARMDGGT